MAAIEHDRLIQGEGRAADREWQAWLAQVAPTALSTDTLIAATRRLVVVAPHPDDEILACGGLLASHTKQGGSALVIAVTDGEASHPGDPDWPPQRLAQARQQEREIGLAWLGLAPSSVRRLGLPDGAVAAQRAALADSLGQLLRAGDVVVTTWRLDGHPDHEAVGAETALACAESGCRLFEAPVWMWHWAAPNDPRVPWERLRALPLSRQAAASKTAALAEHSSQLAPRADGTPVLDAAIRARAAWPAEYLLV